MLLSEFNMNCCFQANIDRDFTASAEMAVHKRKITPPTVNLQVNLIWRSNKIETFEPKERRLPQQLKPTQRKSDPLKLPFGHD